MEPKGTSSCSQKPVSISRFKFINFVFHMFPFLGPKSFTGFTSEILQIMSIDLAWIFQQL
jgi:hypothetical protein